MGARKAPTPAPAGAVKPPAPRALPAKSPGRDAAKIQVAVDEIVLQSAKIRGIAGRQATLAKIPLLEACEEIERVAQTLPAIGKQIRA